MNNFGKMIRKFRLDNELPLRVVAAHLEIDQAILSKFEHGTRKPTREQVVKLAEFFKSNPDELLVAWLADKVIYALEGDDDLAVRAMQVAEASVEYGTFIKVDRKELVKNLISVLEKFGGITKAWIYGSFSRQDDGVNSDVDVAVKTDDSFNYFDLAEIKFQAEKILDRKVDVGFIDSFKPHILENVKPDLKLIYEKK